jgi:hypothetical protein
MPRGPPAGTDPEKADNSTIHLRENPGTSPSMLGSPGPETQN